MKCRVCGYERQIDYVEPECTIGDEDFIPIYFGVSPEEEGNVMTRACIESDEYYHHTGFKLMKLVACPKCGTVRLEECY